MISTRYYSFTAKPALLSMLSEGSLPPDLAFHELFLRKRPDRIKHNDAAELNLVVELYLNNFRRRIVEHGASDSLAEALTSDRSKVNQFWDVTIFEDCEDIDELLKEARQNSETTHS